MITISSNGNTVQNRSPRGRHNRSSAIHMFGRLPDARSSSLARQIRLICVPQLMSLAAARAAPNGGSGASSEGQRRTQSVP
jgi:hypothetical protein